MTDRPFQTGAVLRRGALLSVVLLALVGTCVLYGIDSPHTEYWVSYPGDYDGGENEPVAWEFTYMYAVSLFAAGWVAGRAFVHWRAIPRRILLVPRDRFDSTGVRSDQER